MIATLAHLRPLRIYASNYIQSIYSDNYLIEANKIKQGFVKKFIVAKIMNHLTLELAAASNDLNYVRNSMIEVQPFCAKNLVDTFVELSALLVYQTLGNIQHHWPCNTLSLLICTKLP